MGISSDIFGEFHDPDSGAKTPVKRYTLVNSSGIEVQLIEYGAGISGVVMPDKHGKKENVVLGFDKFEDYTKYNYQGSSIGRHANRIALGKFSLEGKSYQLTINNNANHLHGGERGWNSYVWNSYVCGNSVIFSHLSPDGDQGYPGSVVAQVKYTLDDEGRLTIEFEAMTTKPTPINMTNHAFFNLAGHSAGQKGILDHVVTLNCDRYTPVSSDAIPTGEIKAVGDIGYDLRFPVRFGDALPKVPGGGIDHNFAIFLKRRGELEIAGRFHHPGSGRVLEVYTTEPGIQIYTGNFLPQEKGKMIGRGGCSYTYQGSFCCEPQNFPNSINQSNFPDDVYYPGKPYKHIMVYNFTVEK